MEHFENEISEFERGKFNKMVKFTLIWQAITINGDYTAVIYIIFVHVICIIKHISDMSGWIEKDHNIQMLGVWTLSPGSLDP